MYLLKRELLYPCANGPAPFSSVKPPFPLTFACPNQKPSECLILISGGPSCKNDGETTLSFQTFRIRPTSNFMRPSGCSTQKSGSTPLERSKTGSGSSATSPSSSSERSTRRAVPAKSALFWQATPQKASGRPPLP